MLGPRHGTKVPALERALHALGKRIEPVVVWSPLDRIAACCSHVKILFWIRAIGQKRPFDLAPDSGRTYP